MLPQPCSLPAARAACRCTVPCFMHEGFFCPLRPPRSVHTLCAGCSAEPAANKPWGGGRGVSRGATVWSYVCRALRATSNLCCFYFFPHLRAGERAPQKVIMRQRMGTDGAGRAFGNALRFSQSICPETNRCGHLR